MSEIKESTAKRNSRIIDEYYGTETVPGLSMTQLSRDYGLDRSTIQKLVAIDQGRADFVRAERLKPKDNRVLVGKKPLSQVHSLIGMKIGRHMTEHGLLPTTFGEMIHASRVRVRNIQVGAYDLTLSEVMTISKALEIPYDELVTGQVKEAAIVCS